MTLVARTRQASGSPAGALVLFHGRGADENDLFPLLDALDPDRRLVGVTPRGPPSLPTRAAHCRCHPAVRTGTRWVASARLSRAPSTRAMRPRPNGSTASSQNTV